MKLLDYGGNRSCVTHGMEATLIIQFAADFAPRKLIETMDRNITLSLDSSVLVYVAKLGIPRPIEDQIGNLRVAMQCGRNRKGRIAN